MSFTFKKKLTRYDLKGIGTIPATLPLLLKDSLLSKSVDPIFRARTEKNIASKKGIFVRLSETRLVSPFFSRIWNYAAVSRHDR